MNVNGNYKAHTLDDCYKLLKEHPNAKLIHGGTDVVVKLQDGFFDGIDLIDISTLSDLKGVSVKGSEIWVGAGTTFTEFLDHKDLIPNHLFGLVDAIESIGSPQIRNAGTFGGNICNGSPAADSIPPLIALDATLEIGSESGTRTMPLKEFFLGKGQVDLKEGEVLTFIHFVIPESNMNLQFYKFSPRNALSITLGSIASLYEVNHDVIKNIQIASGGFSAFCQRELEMEQLFEGKNINTLDQEWNACDEIVQARIAGFPDDFKTMKHITLSGALKHTIKGGSES